MKKIMFMILPITLFIFFFTIQLFFSPAAKACAAVKTTNHSAKHSLYSSSLFSYNQTINPWNHTITLKSKRIMRKKEVIRSTLTLSKKGKKKQIYRAKFASLSSNGKKITYTIINKDQKKLCPSNRSKNGKYIVKSSLFSKRNILSYHERIPSNTIAGFIVNDIGKPLAKATVILNGKNKKITIRTDSHGYYKITADITTSKPHTISVSKSGYLSQSKKLKNKLSKGILCENFTLSKKRASCQANNHSIEFEIKNKQDQSLSNTAVYIVQKGTSTILFSGKTDSLGQLLFSNTDTFCNDEYSVIERSDPSNTTRVSVQKKYQPKSKNHFLITKDLLNHNKEYTIFVQDLSSSVQTPCSQTMQFSFRFSDFMTDHLYFSLHLSDCQTLSLQHITLQTKDITLLPTDFVSCSIYTSLKHTPFYTNEWHVSDISENLLSGLDIKKLFLPDGTYFIQFTLYNQTHTAKALSSVLPVSVLRGKAYADTIILQKAQKALSLNFAEYTSTSLQASFDLYQKKNHNYFYQTTLHSMPFFLAASGFQHTELWLAPLYQNEEYLLLPKKNSAFASSYYIFHTTLENTTPFDYQNPLTKYMLKIYCQNSNTSSFREKVPNDFYEQSLYLLENDSFVLSQKEITQSQTTFPCISISYKRNGAFASMSVSKSSNAPRTFIYKKSGLITDIYLNHSSLKTNQPSYQ
ncbi:putative uncharacterized protein [Clostridium sp. CAG:230]|nr:putative uncharacterized protein [Clostridium sp. CAG:230]